MCTPLVNEQPKKAGGHNVVYIDGELVFSEGGFEEMQRKWDGWPQIVASVTARRGRFLSSLQVYNEWRKAAPGSETRRILARLMKDVQSGRGGLDSERLDASERFMKWGEHDYYDRTGSLKNDPVLAKLHDVFAEVSDPQFESIIAPCEKKPRAGQERPDVEPSFFRRYAHLYERVEIAGGDWRHAALFDTTDEEGCLVEVTEDGFLVRPGDEPREEVVADKHGGGRSCVIL